MRRSVVLVVLLLAGCGGAARPDVVRVTVAPAPEGPSVTVDADAVRDALPSALPPTPTEPCRFGATVTLLLADGSRRTYGPCALPRSIERLRLAVVRVAHVGATPPRRGSWRALFKDW